MTKISKTDPARFQLASFSDLLPKRMPITGEEPGSFDAFHRGLMISLASATPYECVLAEHLTSIEWELVQHRRMRDASLRAQLRDLICGAVKNRASAALEVSLDEAWDAHEAEGGTQDNWEEPYSLDEDAALAEGEALAARAVSQDVKEQSAACDEIVAMGADPLELMSQAHTAWQSKAQKHDQKIIELERRCREVRRDFEMLQRERPVEAEAIEA